MRWSSLSNVPHKIMFVVQICAIPCLLCFYDTLSNVNSGFQFNVELSSVTVTNCFCANWDIFCSIVCNYKVSCNRVSLLPGGSVTQFCLHVCAILCNLVLCVLAVQCSELAAWWFFAHWSVQFLNKSSAILWKILCWVQCSELAARWSPFLSADSKLHLPPQQQRITQA